MTVLVDPPRWPAHGRLWSHLVSDVSLAELHAFAAAAGIPRRGFEGDHYDVPGERLGDLVAAGAVAVPAGELLRRLVGSGLRVPKQRGQRVLASRLELRRDGEQVHVDLVAAGQLPPAATTTSVRGLVVVPGGLLLRVRGGGGPLALPGVRPGAGRPLGFTRHRPRPVDGRAPAGRWRHVALVAARADDVDGPTRGRSTGGDGGGPTASVVAPVQPAVEASVGAAVGADGLVVVPVPLAQEACGGPRWWPLVEHTLEHALSHEA